MRSCTPSPYFFQQDTNTDTIFVVSLGHVYPKKITQKESAMKTQATSSMRIANFMTHVFQALWGSGSFIRYEQENVTEPSFS